MPRKLRDRTGFCGAALEGKQPGLLHDVIHLVLVEQQATRQPPDEVEMIEEGLWMLGANGLHGAKELTSAAVGVSDFSGIHGCHDIDCHRIDHRSAPG